MPKLRKLTLRLLPKTIDRATYYPISPVIEKSLRARPLMPIEWMESVKAIRAVENIELVDQEGTAKIMI